MRFFIATLILSGLFATHVQATPSCYPSFQAKPDYKAGATVSASIVEHMTEPCAPVPTNQANNKSSLCNADGTRPVAITRTYNYRCVDGPRSLFCQQGWSFGPASLYGHVAWKKLEECYKSAQEQHALRGVTGRRLNLFTQESSDHPDPVVAKRGKSGKAKRGKSGKAKTSSPSLSPSEVPSTSPSMRPSEVPSTSPSLSPSEVPSTSPSLSPSEVPSTSPSMRPSEVPSSSPQHQFNAKTELSDAIKEYIDQGCSNNPGCKATSDYGGTIGNWDVSRLTDFSELFQDANGFFNAFNEPINWNTESATSMNGMFDRATAFNQALYFDTAKVTDMNSMFFGAKAFNQPLSFDTAKVTDMSYMFVSAAFNQALSFDTAKVTNMYGMFLGATAFNQALSFNTTEVTDMVGMFNSATAFNQPLSFDTAKVTNMNIMFASTAAFNQPLRSFDTAKVTNMKAMFFMATAFNQDLCHFGDNFASLSTVKSMFKFSGCSDKNEPASATGPWCAVTTCSS